MIGKVQSDELRSGLAQRDAEAPAMPRREASSRQPGRRKRICIVGLGSISQNPRVVKEADALTAAGHDVVVLHLQHFEWERVMDRQILVRAKWRAEIVDVSPTVAGRLRKWISGVQLSVFRHLCRWTTRFPVSELAYSRYFFPLLRRAIRHRSDLYIGHYTGSLPVVARAAHRTGAKFGFDFEDFHRADPNSVKAEGLSNKLVAILEDRYLPGASFVTAASWGIGEFVAKTTGLPAPKTVLNVFPWVSRESLSAPRSRPSNSALSLYWYSQIVSLDRGLQDAIRGMGLAREMLTLAIRGAVTPETKAELLMLAHACGVEDRIAFLPIVHPHELLAEAAKHDIGLCLELQTPLNRDICITNKIFLYMLAGLGVVASSTRGHEDVMRSSPDAIFLYPSGDAAALAGVLDRLAQDRQLLARTQTAALASARDRWNWERESKLLVSTIEDAMNSEHPGIGRDRAPGLSQSDGQ